MVCYNTLMLERDCQKGNETLTRRGFLKLSILFSISSFFYPFKGISLEQRELPVTLTPKSLMLHSANEPLVEGLAKRLKELNYRSLTYSEMFENIRNGGCIDGKHILLSLDDLSIEWLNPAYSRIVDTFAGFGFNLTLGVVTRGKPSEKAIQGIYKMIGKGCEIAVHTENHIDLGSADLKTVFREISTCYGKIIRFFDVVPSTLILPFGFIYIDSKDPNKGYNQAIFDVCKELKINWVVGIVGGKSFGGKSPFYVGRISPDGKHNVDATLNLLNNSFRGVRSSCNNKLVP